MKTKLILLFFFLLIIFVWITWAVMYIELPSQILAWAMYFLPLAFSVLLVYFRRINFAVVIMALLSPLTVICELLWARLWGGLNEEQIFGDERITLYFNGYGKPGEFVLMIVIPLFVLSINFFVVNKLKKKEDSL